MIQRKPVLGAVVVVGLVLPLAGSSLAAEKPENGSAVVGGNNRFALELYGKLKAQQGNLFCSPYSISTALAMTYAGARGETATQMAKVLHFELDPTRFHSAYADLINDLNEAGKKGDYQLAVANALWGQQGEPFRKEFLDLVNTRYGGGLQQVDFEHATEAARKTINAWVEQQTKDKIKELIKPAMLDPRATRLVLTNAIYFKGNWALPFKKEQTKDQPFTLADGQKVTAALMRQEAEFLYMEGDDFQALEIPYAGHRLAMTLFLPRKADGLAALERRLNFDDLKKWLAKLSRQQVVVTLPKFKATSEFELTKTLRSLGMILAFSGADLSGITSGGPLSISKILHKAFVEVNEEGTEAAAATAVVLGRASAIAVQRTVEFRADHPFVFLLRDTRTGSILFLGRLANPKAD